MWILITSHLSSEDTPEPERLSAWRDFLGRKFMRTHIEPVAGRRFQIDATLQQIAGLSVVSSFTSGALSRRTRELIDGEDQVVLNIVREGACVVRQRGEEVVCRIGDAVLMPTTEPGMVLRPADTRMLSVSLPRLALAPFAADKQAQIMRRVPAKTPMLQLLTHYLDAMPTALLRSDGDLEKTFAGHVHELLARAIAAPDAEVMGDAAIGAATAGAGLRAARLRAAQHHIGVNLHEPELTPDSIAAALGISVRQLHQLFEMAGTSVMRHVLARRLDHAARLMISVAGRHHGIADIAFRSGFDSLSTFYRAFKKAYGRSPADYRASHLGA